MLILVIGIVLTIAILALRPIIIPNASGYTNYQRHFHQQFNKSRIILEVRKPVQFSYQVNRTATIPHIFHQIWKTNFVPKKCSSWIRSWRVHHPSWTYVFWTHETARELVAAVHPQFLDIYDGYAVDVSRADAVRYIIMYVFGGVYMDLDMESLRPVNQMVDHNTCILAQEPEVHASLLQNLNKSFVSNAFMGCTAGHPLMKSIISALPEHKDEDLMKGTGPLLVENIVQKYLSLSLNIPPLDSVFTAAPHHFNPTFDPTEHGHFKRICDELSKSTSPQDTSKSVWQFQLDNCDNLVKTNFTNDPLRDSYSVHHWLHTYWYPLEFTGRSAGKRHISIHDVIHDAKFGSHFTAALNL